MTNEEYIASWKNEDGSLKNGSAGSAIVHKTKIGRYMGRPAPLQACRSRQSLSQHGYYPTSGEVTCKSCLSSKRS